MYFTREPIVETIITPKEGFKLNLRNSKGGRQEFLVDSVEVISFGKNCFYRTLEKPTSFILPVSDYEIIEVRETKMSLKTPVVEKGIKIGGGREGNLRTPVKEKEEEEVGEEKSSLSQEEERRGGDKKRDRRRFRRRKERDDLPQEESTVPREEKAVIPPPTTLISETISRYKELPSFAGAFFDRSEKEEHAEVAVETEESSNDSFEEEET